MTLRTLYVLFFLVLLSFNILQANERLDSLEKLCETSFYSLVDKYWPDLTANFVLYDDFPPGEEDTEYEYMLYSLGSINDKPIGIYCSADFMISNQLNSIRVVRVKPDILLLHIEYNSSRLLSL